MKRRYNKVYMQLHRRQFECGGNTGSGARKRAYVTSVANGPHHRPSLWRYFFHPMVSPCRLTGSKPVLKPPIGSALEAII